jgi:hypothetical protein
MKPTVTALAKTAVEAICIRCNETCRSTRSSHCDIVVRKDVYEMYCVHEAEIGESYHVLAVKKKNNFLRPRPIWFGRFELRDPKPDAQVQRLVC